MSPEHPIDLQDFPNLILPKDCADKLNVSNGVTPLKKGEKFSVTPHCGIRRGNSFDCVVDKLIVNADGTMNKGQSGPDGCSRCAVQLEEQTRNYFNRKP
jgi:hypothetical protein